MISTIIVDRSILFSFMCKFFGLFFILQTNAFLLWYLDSCLSNDNASGVFTNRTVSLVNDSPCSANDAFENVSSVSKQNVSQAI